MSPQSPDFHPPGESAAPRSESEAQAATVLGPGAAFEGKLTFDGAVRIDGEFRGEIRSDGTLIVGPQAYLEAEITIGNLVVEGKVVGNVEATHSIEIRAPATVHGDLRTRNLEVHKGAVFEGNCHMDGDS